MVRKEIDSLAALRGKSLGVQSIGGGFWLQAMMVLDGVGVDPDKFGMKLRVIGEEPTIVQALLAGNIDASVFTLPSAAVAKRSGMRGIGELYGNAYSTTNRRHLRPQRALRGDARADYAPR